VKKAAFNSFFLFICRIFPPFTRSPIKHGPGHGEMVEIGAKRTLRTLSARLEHVILETFTNVIFETFTNVKRKLEPCSMLPVSLPADTGDSDRWSKNQEICLRCAIQVSANMPDRRSFPVSL
jgi:hypothetical protein